MSKEVFILLNKSKKDTTFMILIDAFSKTYCTPKYTPFLYHLAQEGILTHLKPLFAFRGIDTTIFTGMFPNVHNVWTEFCFVRKFIGSRKCRILEQIIKLISLLPNDEYKAKLRYLIERYLFNRPCKNPNLIPAAATCYFETSQKKEITEAGAIGNIQTLFDIFRRKGVKYNFIEPWISGDRGVLFKAKREIKKNYDYDFWYLKFNCLDHLGHKFGPNPSEFSDHLKKIDIYVKEIVTFLLRKNPKLKILVLADHGMSKVKKTINILEGIDQLRSRMYEDYVAFADSTMIRFWFFKEKAKNEIVNYLRQIKCGHILTTREKKILKIPLDLKYGEIIYVINESYVIHPDFFHSKFIVNGMHGYAYPRTPEALPVLIMNGQMAQSFHIDRAITYADILPLILRSLSCIS